MSLIIDIFVAVLLVSAIGYGMVLNRRIVALRRDQANLERLAISFHEATSRAESSVGNLKKAAQSASQILNKGIDDATRVCADLDFLVERGEKLGDRLEGSVRQAENSPKAVMQPKAVLNPVEPANEFFPVQTKQNLPARQNEPANARGAESLGNEIVKSEAERELIKALQAVR